MSDLEWKYAIRKSKLFWQPLIVTTSHWVFFDKINISFTVIWVQLDSNKQVEEQNEDWMPHLNPSCESITAF